MKSWPSLCLLLCLACFGPRDRAMWVERELPIRSEEVLWQYALAALAANDFPVGMGANPGQREIVSGWRVELQPFRGEGFRERARMSFERTDTGFDVRARVEREINQDIVRPLDPTFARWEKREDNEAMAERLVQFIDARLGKPLELREAPVRKLDDVEEPWERR